MTCVIWATQDPRKHVSYIKKKWQKKNRFVRDFRCVPAWVTDLFNTHTHRFQSTSTPFFVPKSVYFEKHLLLSRLSASPGHSWKCTGNHADSSNLNRSLLCVASSSASPVSSYLPILFRILYHFEEAGKTSFQRNMSNSLGVVLCVNCVPRACFQLNI